MTAIREPGKINENTTLIDAGLQGVGRVNAVYLIKAEKSCLIDSGSKKGAELIIQTLNDMNIGLPDLIVLTHSHWDHCQGVSVFRNYAQKQGKTIEIMASEKSLPLLADQSFNDVYGHGKWDNITNIKPLKEGDIIDLGGLTMKVFEVPGHMPDHIALLDEKNKNLFVGDALGDKLGDDAFIPPSMPPYFNQYEFLSSLEKLKGIEFDSLSMSHFGYIFDEEAKKILGESESIFKKYEDVIQKHMERLDDIDFMMETLKKATNAVIPDFPIQSPLLKMMLPVINVLRKLLFKSKVTVGDILFPKYLKYLIDGYQNQKIVFNSD